MTDRAIVDPSAARSNRAAPRVDRSEQQETRAPSSTTGELQHDGGVRDLYRSHARHVVRWATRIGGPLVDPEEVLQEVFVVVHRRLSEFEGHAKIDTWLYRITERVALSKRRRERFRHWLRGSPADVEQASSEARMQPIDGALDPHTRMQRDQDAALLSRLLERLPDRYRRVVILYELEELSGHDIAERLQIPLGTVWARLARGRERLIKAHRQHKLQNEDAP